MVALENPSLPVQVSPPVMTLELSPFAKIPRRGAVLAAIPVLLEDGDVVLGPGAAEIGEATGVDLMALLDQHVAEPASPAAAGQVLVHATPGHPDVAGVALVGLGEARAVDHRRAGAALGRVAKDRDTVHTTITGLADEAGLRAFVVGLTLSSFEFHWRSSGPKSRPVRRVVLAGDKDRQACLDRAVAVAHAGWLARSLATVPSNLKNPAWLADQAREAASGVGVKVSVWDEKMLEADEFGGILAVGRASATPPRLIRMDYTPRRAKGHVVLVGKGITFDTGGLSIKPGEAMVNMKRDMTGGAVVIAVMSALKAVGCPIKVTGLVASAENAIGADAYRPGDVIRHFGGRTTEVTNTDAEGRLVMADALAYAAEKVKPDAVVDVATLTGAMKIALGLRTGGYFANDDQLAERLAQAAVDSGESMWRMPLASNYQEKLSSKVADSDNGAGNPGAITAALFLQPFVGGLPWAHLDIASVGDAPEAWDEWTPGPTGFGARTLLQWLERDNPLEGVR